MKAEERKELETNVLADRVGKLVTKMKGGPSRKTMFWVVLAVVLVVGVFFYIRSRTLEKERQAGGWFVLGVVYNPPAEESRIKLLSQCATEFPKESSGLGAAVELTWYQLDRVAHAYRRELVPCLRALNDLCKDLQLLEDRCKEDPTLLPEVKYHMAVCYEMRSVLDDVSFAELPLLWPLLDSENIRKKQGFLKAAEEQFQVVADAHPESAFGKMAKKRLENYTDDKRRKEMTDMYLDMGRVGGQSLMEQLQNAHDRARLEGKRSRE